MSQGPLTILPRTMAAPHDRDPDSPAQGGPARPTRVARPPLQHFLARRQGEQPAWLHEEVARRILEPAYPALRARRWFRVKRRHDRLERFLRSPLARAAILGTMDRLAAWRPARPLLAEWFLAG